MFKKIAESAPLCMSLSQCSACERLTIYAHLFVLFVYPTDRPNNSNIISYYSYLVGG